jgi:hypothetical protein
MKDNAAFHLAENLRTFADFVDEHAADLPDQSEIDCYTYLWDWNVAEGESVPIAMSRAMRAGLKSAATVKKEYSDNYFRLYMDFGIKQPVQFKIVCNRDEVCEKHVVGTEKVMKQIAPAGKWTEEEVEQDIVEWKCNPLLNVVDTK